MHDECIHVIRNAPIDRNVCFWIQFHNSLCASCHTHRSSCFLDHMFISFLELKHMTLQWRHTERDGVPNHQPHDCLFNRLFRRRSKKTSKLRVTGLCEGNSQVTGEFPAQRASNAENVYIWWRRHGFIYSMHATDSMHVHACVRIISHHAEVILNALTSPCHCDGCRCLDTK